MSDLEAARKELYEQAGNAFGHTGQPLEAFLRELERFIDLKIADAKPPHGPPTIAKADKPRPVRKKLAEKPKPKKRK